MPGVRKRGGWRERDRGKGERGGREGEREEEREGERKGTEGEGEKVKERGREGGRKESGCKRKDWREIHKLVYHEVSLIKACQRGIYDS